MIDNTLSIPHLYLEQVNESIGFGVFSKVAYCENDLVETCPMVLISTPYSRLDTSLKHRVFAWGKLTGDSTPFALALGYGSLYNHANPANLQYCADRQKTLMQFKAVRDIKAGEQLTINYNGANGSHISDDDAWFKRVDITPEQF